MVGLVAGVAWILAGPGAALVVALLLIPPGVIAQTIWSQPAEHAPKQHGPGWGWTFGLMLSWLGPLPYIGVHRRPR